jgi:phosphohistidine phosphatase
MKHLILIRHAETAEKVTGQTDKDRELTTAGMRQAAAVGHYLKNHSTSVDIIISSAALRAATTAQLIGEQINSNDDLVETNDELYQASVGTLFEIIRSGDEHHNVAIVGHNPTISYFAEFLTGSALDDMRPATVLILKLDVGSWKELQKGSATLLDRFDA